MTFIKCGAYFSRTHKPEMRIFSGLHKPAMHIVEALIHRSCIFLSFIKSWCAFLRRSQWGATPIHQNKLNIYAACRIYELGSCIPGSRPTMHDSVPSLANAQALCPPAHHANCGTSPAFCTPMMKLPTVSGFEHVWCTPLTKIAGRLRLFAPPS